jgi:hypothetical protein
MSTPPSAIEIRTSFFPLAFLLYLCTARASIDGSEPVGHGWNTRLYPVPAGRHRVTVWCPYLFLTRMGEATVDVEVLPGQVVGVHWKAPWFTLLPGTWSVLGVRGLAPGELAANGPVPQPYPQPQPQPQAQPQPAAGGPPPGWHPDPHRQAAHRWWDGQRWTEHVSNG